MTLIPVAPAPGRAVPDPEAGGLLPAAGRAVAPTQYWLRRLADGDVVRKPVAAPAAKKKEA